MLLADATHVFRDNEGDEILAISSLCILISIRNSRVRLRSSGNDILLCVVLSDSLL